ncbi:hypothetical protein NAPIS_ORF01693 [Vairimorpha apis BRL 01]|uniref:Uncharacterized protein n=1 Tax=Vairimorpha apis BRL 01 TaxID=1037528 RepID=T0KZK5_9MICR|nr:hypothetical protein NAPIS_ORF01693 [Vairimorpha apis BRL 01]
MCSHCNQSKRTVDHMATRCKKMLGHNYTRRHNEIESNSLNIVEIYKKSKEILTVEMRLDLYIVILNKTYECMLLEYRRRENLNTK